MSPELLNLACGHRHHPDWVNVDLVATGEDVLKHDLTQGLPFADAEFDAVYSSHFLEHLSRADGAAFLRECHRVLRPRGVIRVVVPDLEGLTRAYIEALEEARRGSKAAAANYDWLLLEMFDQVGRDTPGGDMVAYLSRKDMPNRDFVARRIGCETEHAGAPEENSGAAAPKQATPGVVGRVVRCARNLVRHPEWFREAVKKRVLGTEYEMLRVGRFRCSGEVHRTMYDDYSLGRVLEANGFSDVRSRPYDESEIPGWERYGLDANADGSRGGEASLYLEGRKVPAPPDGREAQL